MGKKLGLRVQSRQACADDIPSDFITIVVLETIHWAVVWHLVDSFHCNADIFVGQTLLCNSFVTIATVLIVKSVAFYAGKSLRYNSNVCNH